ncbi:MAG: helix-turn-helix transcriptional regulator [Burkholderiales bacterium]|nr:helix-turn-helix transcriptional regulator [Burkholderiales bacterium]
MKSIPIPTTQDYSEQAHGAALICLKNEESEASQFPLGTRKLDWHRHHRGQVFCIENGLMHVRTQEGTWILPPFRAGWIPPGELHQISVVGALQGWTVLLLPEVCAALPQQASVLSVNEVMRAIVKRATSWQPDADLTPEQHNLMRVLLDELQQAPLRSFHLPMPQTARLITLAEGLLQSPGKPPHLGELAEQTYMSTRTLSRLFRAETGLSIGLWSQQANLLHAVERLALGHSVAQVADDLGYATASNFIAMFKRHFGETPGKYMQAQELPQRSLQLTPVKQ